MGWWKVQGANDVVGDEVCSLLREAALRVAVEYQREFARPPTRSEWERLLRDALQPIESLEPPSQQSVIADEVAQPSAVRILTNA